MGNQESKPQSGAGSGQNASHAPGQHGGGHQHHHHHERRGTHPRRRESVHSASLPGTKATASPSHAASLTSATATTTNSSKRSAEETLKKAALPHSHTPSQPPPPPQQHHHPQPVASAPQLRTADASADAMGNSSSKDAAKSAADKAKLQTADPAARPSPLPRPIDVPAAQAPAPSAAEPFSPSVANASAFADASYQFATPSAFSRPPRLPLPIGEEVHAPGSPILSPAERSETIGPIEDIQLSRRASVLSGTTVEDDDVGDDVSSLEPWGGAPTVPTLLEWREDGEKVYVTGTFAGWDKKFRLHRNGPSKYPGALSAYINLFPGTHHVRFIVDNDSRLSKSMPTAVDYNNFLVNYIEVTLPTPPEGQDKTEAPKQAAATTSPAPTTSPPSASPGAHPPQVLPAAPAPAAPPTAPKGDATPRVSAQAAKDHTSSDTLASQIAQPKTAPIAVGPEKKYHTRIPQYLLDIEAEDDQNLYPRASALISTLPEPPSLPMFLGKSVLNGATPMKDDASVLVMPNHTVLNHLATSSIKNKVLATSATTRYKKKFLTTIMYKPTSPAKD